MKYEELRTLLLSTFPNGELEEDEDGQFIIYTGLKNSPDWLELVPFEG
jgi:hypothetical protein